MRILCVGALPTSIWDVVASLRGRRDHITLVGEDVPPAPGTQPDRNAQKPFFEHRSKLHSLLKHVQVYSMSPERAQLEQIMHAGWFDAVIFFYSYQCEPGEGQNLGMRIDILGHTIKLCQQFKVSKFIMITDQSVFGSGQEMREDESPQPDALGGSLIELAEEYVRKICQIPHMIVRVTSLYAYNDPDTFFTQVLKGGRLVRFPGPAGTPCDFLHAADLGAFLRKAVQGDVRGVVHLAYGKKCVYANVAAFLVGKRQDLRIVYGEEPVRQHTLQVARAYKEYDWVPQHAFDEPVPEPAPKKRSRVLSRVRAARPMMKTKLGQLFRWVELVLMAVVMQLLVNFTQTNANFRVVDVRLLYVVLIGSVHGIFPGAVAGLIAYASYAAGYLAQGHEIADLFFNMDDWLAFVLYMFAGIFLGYSRDRHESRQIYLADEQEKNVETLKYMEKVYHDTCEIRDELYDQVIHSRDSYGRIYAIAKELDTLQPDMVFLKALSVLENVMDNQHIAIYVQPRGSVYARLYVESRQMRGVLSNTLNLGDMPEVRQTVESMTIYTNTKLTPNNPIYCAPLRMSDELNVLIIIWQADVSQQTMYYKNLFHVVTGLISSSLSRALQFLHADPSRCVTGTTILSQKAFMEALEVRRQMNDQLVGHYLLLRVTAADGAALPQLQELSARLQRCTRATDEAGLMDNGECYLLMMQAEEADLPIIRKRLGKERLDCTLAGEVVTA